MRLFTWILGLLLIVGYLMIAYAIARPWIWVWWSLLGVWFVLGLGVAVTGLVSALLRRQGSAAVSTGTPRPIAPRQPQPGEGR